MSAAEAYIYSNWLLILRLLKIGIPYDSINELDGDSISIILGVDSAIVEKQQEQINNNG